MYFILYSLYRSYWNLRVNKLFKYFSSKGVIHDFAGSFYVSFDDFAFGEPYKYVQLNPSDEEKAKWDSMLYMSDCRFNNEEHNLFT